MNENITMTRISELPEPGQMQPSFPQQQPAFPQQQPSYPQQQPMHGQATSFPQMGEMSTMYVPLNPHPNPYGIPDQPPGGMIPPQSQNPYAQPRPPIDGIPHIGPEHRLPMHDIPMDLTTYTHDEQIKPNYVPKPKITADYIRRHENATEHNVREYEAEKRAEAHRSEWFEALNMPIMAAVLFLIYQLPVINTLIFKRFSFLQIYAEDGNFNMWGLVAKSFLFGMSIFSVQQSISTINNYLY